MDIFDKLKKVSYRSVLNRTGYIRSSAVIISEDHKEFFGVEIVLKERRTSAITNAICNAVSNGYRQFDKVYVFIDSEYANKLSLDKETIALLKEFNISRYSLFTNCHCLYDQKVDQ